MENNTTASQDNTSANIDTNVEDSLELVSDKGKPVVKTEAKVEDTNVDKVDDAKVKFEMTNDPGMNLALNWISKLGYSPDNELVKLAFDGDFSALRADLAGRTDSQGYSEYLSIAENFYKRNFESEVEKLVQKEKKIFEIAGGEEAWGEIRAWVKGNSTQEEVDVYNQMIDHSPLQAAIVTEYLSNKFRSESNADFEPVSKVVTNTATNSNGTKYALSPQDYQREINELSKRIGSHNVDRSPEYAELRKRRSAYRN